MTAKYDVTLLMTSRQIKEALDTIAEQGEIKTDREMVAIAALKFSRAEFMGASVATVAAKLRLHSDTEISYLAKAAHPVQCALQLEKWQSDTGETTYAARNPRPRGKDGQRILLTEDGVEISLKDWQQRIAAISIAA
ncbi:MAG: hypothetical protein V7711_06835 [Pseudomonadales bacterium]